MPLNQNRPKAPSPFSLGANNNRKPTWKLALRSLKTFRFRTFCMLFTIFTCTFVMTVLPYVNSAEQIKIWGDYAAGTHVSYGAVGEKTAKALEKDPHFESTVQIKTAEFGKLEDVYCRPAYVADSKKSNGIYELIGGQLPEKENEILLEDTLAKQLSIQPHAAVTFLDSSGNTTVFVLAGIVKTHVASSIPSFYVSESFGKNSPLFSGRKFNFEARLSKELFSGNYDRDVNLLLDIGKNYEIAAENISINSLSLDGNPFLPSRLAFYVLLNLGTLTAGILVIYSIFRITVLSRIREFGQMRTLGMSGRQIKRMLNQEGSILCLTGSLPGILSGLFAGVLKTGFWNFQIGLFSALFTFFCSYAFIMLFLQKPIKMASRMSPAEAARFAEGSIPEFHCALSPKALGKMRVKRDRKRMLFTRLSLLASGILMLLSGTYIATVSPEALARSHMFQNADYILGYKSDYLYASQTELLDFQKLGLLGGELTKELEALSQVTSVRKIHSASVTLQTSQGPVSDSLFGITEEDFNQISPYLEDSSITWEKLLEENAVLASPPSVYSPEDFLPGEEITLQFYDGEAYRTSALPIAGLVDREAASLGTEFASTLYSPVPVLEKLLPGTDSVSQLYLSVQGHRITPALTAQIEQILGKYSLISCLSFTDYSAELARQSKILDQLFLAGSLIVLFFSILNLLNSSISKMFSQDRELALYETVGMTPKQIRSMLIYESLLFTAPIAVLTSILGIGSGYVMYLALFSQSLSYHLPFGYLLFYLGFLLLVPICIPLLCYRHFAKKPLMERLKTNAE